MKPTMIQSIGFATAMAVAAILPAGAANTFYAPGDLVLFFQQEGGSNTVYANLGKAADYRGTAAGPAGGSPVLNIVDLNTTLTGAFGPGWASDASVYAGLAAVWGTSSLSSTLQDGDPNRTVYVSDPRVALGNIYQQGSTGYVVPNTTSLSTASSAITNQNSVFENQYDSLVTVSLASVSRIDENNPFLAPGIQGTGFGIFAGGVQQPGSAGNMGSVDSLGLGTVEFALDLHRILARNDIAGQVGGPALQSTFEGTFLVGTNGLVSFIPEPSSFALSGLAAVALLMRRRRHA
jgi:hypothetical protein